MDLKTLKAHYDRMVEAAESKDWDALEAMDQGWKQRFNQVVSSLDSERLTELDRSMFRDILSATQQIRDLCERSRNEIQQQLKSSKKNHKAVSAYLKR